MQTTLHGDVFIIKIQRLLDNLAERSQFKCLIVCSIPFYPIVFYFIIFSNAYCEEVRNAEMRDNLKQHCLILI